MAIIGLRLCLATMLLDRHNWSSEDGLLIIAMFKVLQIDYLDYLEEVSLTLQSLSFISFAHLYCYLGNI